MEMKAICIIEIPSVCWSLDISMATGLRTDFVDQFEVDFESRSFLSDIPNGVIISTVESLPIEIHTRFIFAN